MPCWALWGPSWGLLSARRSCSGTTICTKIHDFFYSKRVVEKGSIFKKSIDVPSKMQWFLRASLRQKIASSAVLLFFSFLLFFYRFWALSACWHTQEWLTKTHLLRNLSKTKGKSRVLGPPGGQAWLCEPPGGCPGVAQGTPQGPQNAQKNVASFFMVTGTLPQIYRFL